MNSEQIYNYIQQYNAHFELPDSMSSKERIECDYIELVPDDIIRFSDNHSESISRDWTNSSFPYPGSILIFYNYQMIAGQVKGRAEFLTEQKGMKEDKYFFRNTDDLLNVLCDESSDNTSICNLIQWMIKPQGNSDFVSQIFKRLIVSGIKRHCRSISGNSSNCIVYIPPFSKGTTIPNWNDILESISFDDIDLNISFKDLGSLIQCKPEHTHYLMFHAEDKNREYLLISAYRNDVHCIGSLAFDIKQSANIEELQIIPTFTTSPEHKNGHSPVDTAVSIQSTKKMLTPIKCRYTVEDNLYSFLSNNGASYFRKTYKMKETDLRSSNGQETTHSVINQIQKVFSANRELQVIDICAKLLNTSELSEISCGDVTYIAAVLEQAKNHFVETGVSIHKKASTQFGAYGGIKMDYRKIFNLPSNFSEITWKLTRGVIPIDYKSIKRNNIKTFHLNQVILSTIDHYDNCTAENVASDLLALYMPDLDIEPSAFFTAKVFLYLSAMQETQIKSIQANATDGFESVDKTYFHELHIPSEHIAKPTKKQKVIHKTSFDSLGWYKKDLVLQKRDVTIEEMNLSIRAYNCLHRAGIRHASNLAQMTWEDLMKVRNLGKKGAKEVVSKLGIAGFSLKNND